LFTGADGRDAGAVEARGGGVIWKIRTAPGTFRWKVPGTIRFRGGSTGVGFGWVIFGWGGFGFGFEGPFGFGTLTFERPE